MKEIGLGRVTGPSESIPFKNYIQSPVGLVPKAGNKTRMIFHLSYNFSDTELSLNACTPKEKCSVKFNDLDTTVQQCLKVYEEALRNVAEIDHQGELVIYLGKTDLTSAFHVLLLKISCICWLVFKLRDPKDEKTKYFVEKCLPFGASISCSHYQRFSNSLKHILKYCTGSRGREETNYLDDFLFIALLQAICDKMIKVFMKLCQEINIPIAVEKTEWACMLIIFLGILMDGEHRTLSIPVE